MAEKKLTLQNPNEVIIRMYNQGFGDCFLIVFPRLKPGGGQPDLTNPVYVVIDSGVFFRTPGEKKRMQAVARSLKRATGGTIDLLVATHEHYDHLSGFELASKEWQEIAVRRIWLAWTEDITHPNIKPFTEEKVALAQQAENARNLVESHQAEDPALAAGLLRAIRLAEFIGDDLPVEKLAADDDSIFEEVKKPSKIPQSVLFDFANDPGKRFKGGANPTERDFCEPGQVRTVPETAVDAYILGPPTDGALLRMDFLESEVYPEEITSSEPESEQNASIWARISQAAAADQAARSSLGAALARHAAGQIGEKDGLDAAAPFRTSLSIPYDQARQDAFFQQHYFEVEPKRMIELDWLHDVSRLALQLDNFTNNTSLALAFRLPDPDDRVLLFVGDAQVGNWLSWHKIRPEEWRRPGGGVVDYRPTATELLAKTRVYKVGHHGSHNATLKAKGLELMPDGLIAFVPTSIKIPQEDRKNPWNIPLPILMARLKEKTQGQMLLAHDKHDYTSSTFSDQVETATEKLSAMKRKDKQGKSQEVEPQVALWRQIRI